MKTFLTRPTFEQAQAERDTLLRRNVYACVSGCEKHGYQVLVRSLQTNGTVPETHAGGNA